MRRVVGWIALCGAAFGCQMIAGVDFGAVHARGEGVGGCPSGQKFCDSDCVPVDDPGHGCAADACTSCSVPFAASVGCKDGACAETACVAGRADCDGDPSNGCEADLSDVAQCASCGTVCGPGQVCAPSGCTASCPQGLVKCGDSCVDLWLSPAHCGRCEVSCPPLANADPACTNALCTIACRSGFGDCDQDPKNGCEALKTFYADGDKDGYGVPSPTTLACTAPAGYAANSGDCLDTDPNVHPGQTNYFGTPYTNSGGKASFDYNCNGVEELATEQMFTGCGGACSGSGYVTATCGSTAIGYCIPYPTCTPHTTNGSPYPCR